MADVNELILKLTNELDKVPKTLASHMVRRDMALTGPTSDESRKYLEQTEYWETTHTLLTELASSLSNCQPTLEKLAKQAAKDRTVLREAAKKAGTASFDAKHPIYRAQRAALDLAVRKCDYPVADFDNLTHELSRNRSVQGVPELKRLAATLTSHATLISEQLAIISRNLRSIRPD